MQRYLTALGDPHQLAQLGVKSGVGVHAPGGVGQHHVERSRGGAVDRVEQHGAGVGALPLSDHRNPETLAVRAELLHRGGAERVGGSEQHAPAAPLEERPQLRQIRGLADAVDADGHHHGQPLQIRLEGRHTQTLQHALADGGKRPVAAPDAAVQAVEQLLHRARADVRFQQRILDQVPTLRLRAEQLAKPLAQAEHQPAGRSAVSVYSIIIPMVRTSRYTE